MPAPDDRSRTSRLTAIPGAPLTLVRREAARMPLVAITVALEAWQRTRGVRSFALRRGNEVIQIVAHTPLGRFLPQPVIDDDADAEAVLIASAARTATAAPRPVATPAPAPPSAEAVAAGAPGVVTDEVDRIADALDQPAPESREDLPIHDFDNISLGSLRARLRSLSREDLVTLRDWEHAHANRLPVVTLLENRIAKVAAGDEGGTLRV